jgi:hypothetical protein
VSIIPGIDSREPERTDKSSGSLQGCRDLGAELGRLLAGAHVDHAGLAGDHEAGGHQLGAEQLRHLADVGALAAEQVAHRARALGEVVDVLLAEAGFAVARRGGRPWRGGVDRLFGHMLSVRALAPRAIGGSPQPRLCLIRAGAGRNAAPARSKSIRRGR